MKKLKRSKLFFLAVPVLLLIGYLASAGRGKSRFEVESPQVLSLPSDAESTDGGLYDTQVNIFIRDNRPFFERLQERTTHWGLEDERLFYLDKDGKERDVNRIHESIKPRKNGLWQVAYRVSLQEIPKNATKVALTANITVNDKAGVLVNVRLK